MSYSEIEFGDAEESQVSSSLYARVNIENKTNRKNKNLEKRISNKYEFVIPVENISELSTSDSNLHSNHVSSESLLSSRSIFGSADNIITDKSLQNESPYDAGLVRHNTGTFRKIQAPPPAIPPPYQVRGEYEIIQSQPTTDASPFRRSKSTNTKSLLAADKASNQKLELSNKPPKVIPNGFNTCPRKMVPQSFRLPKDKPKPAPGIILSLPTKPAMKPRIPVSFNSQNSFPIPIPILAQRKPSPPENNNNDKTPSPPLNNNNNRKQSSPLTTINTSPPPLPLSKPTKSLSSVPLKPILKPPIISPTPPTHTTTPPQLKKQVPLSPPPAINPAKPPARLPPPPPAHSLTLPRNLTSPPPKSPSIGDYTLLTPISPDTSPTDTPLFSPDEAQNLLTDEGYTILNVEDIQTNKAIKELKSLELKRVESLPLENNSKRIPPKKPPRLLNTLTTTTTLINSDPNYTILSSLETSVMSLNDRPPATEFPNDSDGTKTMTMPVKATRALPPKPPAYRQRSQSQTVAGCISISFNNSNNHTSSVEVKPEAKNKGGHTSEGNIFSKVFQKSKRIREKDRGESRVSPTISSPILCPHGAMKVVGLNPLLVSECIAYLKQPKYLREEGIFRIPGDLNQINLYHKQFDYSMKTNLDEELDPNTIASLLKQHIKDNGGLLPTREAGDLYSAVRRKNVEEIRTVVNRIPAEQKNALKEMIYLFKEVCQHAEENKMCTGSIATSCGLSLFPTVNAGNANLMLKSLIDNPDQVFN